MSERLWREVAWEEPHDAYLVYYRKAGVTGERYAMEPLSFDEMVERTADELVRIKHPMTLTQDARLRDEMAERIRAAIGLAARDGACVDPRWCGSAADAVMALLRERGKERCLECGNSPTQDGTDHFVGEVWPHEPRWGKVLELGGEGR